MKRYPPPFTYLLVQIEINMYGFDRLHSISPTSILCEDYGAVNLDLYKQVLITTQPTPQDGLMIEKRNIIVRAGHNTPTGNMPEWPHRKRTFAGIDMTMKRLLEGCLNCKIL